MMDPKLARRGNSQCLLFVIAEAADSTSAYKLQITAPAVIVSSRTFRYMLHNFENLELYLSCSLFVTLCEPETSQLCFIYILLLKAYPVVMFSSLSSNQHFNRCMTLQI